MLMSKLGIYTIANVINRMDLISNMLMSYDR